VIQVLENPHYAKVNKVYKIQFKTLAMSQIHSLPLMDVASLTTLSKTKVKTFLMNLSARLILKKKCLQKGIKLTTKSMGKIINHRISILLNLS